MTREIRVRKTGRRFETPHGSGYTLMVERPVGDSPTLTGYSAEGYAVQASDGSWFTYDANGDLLVRAYNDGYKLWCVLLEHARLLDLRERAE